MSRLPAAVARHRGVLVVTAVVIVIAAVIVLTVATGRRTGSGASAPPPSTTGGPSGELLALLARSSALNYDVRYQVTNQGSGPSTAHLWRRPPLARFDTESGSGDGARRTVEVVTPSGPQRCAQEGSAPWSCAADPGLRLGDVNVVPPNVASRLAALQVTAGDDTVAGEHVRCFTLSARNQPPAEICLTTDGIPARVVLGGSRLDLVAVSRARPPDSVFRAPG